MMSWKFIKNNKIVHIIEKEEKESVWNKTDTLMIEKRESWLKRRLFPKGLDEWLSIETSLLGSILSIFRFVFFYVSIFI